MQTIGDRSLSRGPCYGGPGRPQRLPLSQPLALLGFSPSLLPGRCAGRWGVDVAWDVLPEFIEFDSCFVIDSVTRRYALTDTQWDCIKDLLPGRAGHVGAPSKNNRLFVDAVLYRYRAGIAWRDLPERFGDFRVIHTRHMRWSRSGVWQRVFETLSAQADNEYAMIDATIVRAHQHSAGAKGGFKSMPLDAAEGLKHQDSRDG